MHSNGTTTDTALVRRLLTAQFPVWAELPLEPVGSHGTVNAVYRLGADLAVRMPRVEGGSEDVATEHRWLPRLAPHLPAAVSLPVVEGVPGEGYPWSWSVCRWIDGDNPVAGSGGAEFAADVAEFVLALRRVDTIDGPAAYRGEPLAVRDTATRGALDALHGVVDTGASAAVWSDALRVPGPRATVWVHGDLQPGNVLVADGRLGGVIDFGCMGLADPAVDLIAAWYLLPSEARRVFRSRVGADAAEWARGRGWALSIALMELSSYRTANPVMASTARHVIGEILEDAH
ncbi:aminoglycoside phosphotransferase family protein [Streptomyces sp. NPDC102282]|uniref:aminoglycoside phosphotransferase family protein n=1 Tax=Streptomyces sp. NPDC102282 TaxID=3366154 RepID=UPI0037FD758F